ncbi:unnamed protein product [Parajaminaea phylloscopi]
MAGYDPVRELSNPIQSPHSSTPGDAFAYNPHASHSRSPDAGQEAAADSDYRDAGTRSRLPSRSASIVSLLNPTNTSRDDRPASTTSFPPTPRYRDDGGQQSHSHHPSASPPSSSHRRMSIDGLVSASSPDSYNSAAHHQSQVPPLPSLSRQTSQTSQPRRSPSLHLHTVLSPSPSSGFQRPRSRPGSSSLYPSEDRGSFGNGSSFAAESAERSSYVPEYGGEHHRRQSLTRPQGHSPTLSAPGAHYGRVWQPSSPHSEIGSASHHHTHYSPVPGTLQSPLAGSYPLPHQAGSPSHTPSMSAMSSMRSSDGFRVPSLPLHRSPETRKVPLPPMSPSASESHGRLYTGPPSPGPRDGHTHQPLYQPLSHFHPSTPTGSTSSGLNSAETNGHEYFKMPRTPGGRDVLLAPVTPGVPPTPGTRYDPVRGFDDGGYAGTTSATTRSHESETSELRIRRGASPSLREQGAPRSAWSAEQTTHHTGGPDVEMARGLDDEHLAGGRGASVTKTDGARTEAGPTPRKLQVEPAHTKPQREDIGSDSSEHPAVASVVAPATDSIDRNAEQADHVTADDAPREESKTQSHGPDGRSKSPSTQPSTEQTPDVGRRTNSDVSLASTSVDTPQPSEMPAAMVGKVIPLSSDELEKLAQRDTKKRKSSAMAPEGTPVKEKLAKTQQSDQADSSVELASGFIPSSLPPKPSNSVHEAARGNEGDAASTSTTLPYLPTKRVSRPDAVRRPLSRNDLVQLHEIIEARGANQLRRRWRDSERRNGNGEPKEGFWEAVVPTWGKGSSATSSPSQAMQSGSVDAGRAVLGENEVARHYNNRQETGLRARNFSPILPLKNFNNWVKSVLIGSFGIRGGRAMDMGGGKGGDLQKWDKLGIRELVLADIAATSVEQAEARYRERRFRWKASFWALDCFGESLADRLPPAVLETPFDTVSLQFCMHYGWSSLQRARLVIENISRYLAVGGVFIGTIPNQEELYSRLDALPQDQLEFGNTKYHVRFEQRDQKKPFGDKYTFFLDDAVDEVPEYVVDWSQFQALAYEYGLELIFKQSMEEVWASNRVIPEFEALARRMKVSETPRRDVLRPAGMDDDLWEATTLYLAFAFRKVR